jgi:hypothetical protein
MFAYNQVKRNNQIGEKNITTYNIGLKLEWVFNKIYKGEK